MGRRRVAAAGVVARPVRSRAAGLRLLGTCGAVAASACAWPASPAPGLEPCDVPEVPGAVWCGRVEVPEDRHELGARALGLRVVVLEATGEEAEPDPVYGLMGGPGAGAAAAAPGFARRFDALRARRHVVLVDSRGTGGSDPLACDAPASPAGMFGGFLPREEMRRCRERHAERALHRYDTHQTALDLETVRAALGHERINLAGTSYATRVILHYTRLHPERVRTATVVGVVPVGKRGSETYGPDLVSALERLAGYCAADAACAQAYPDFETELAQSFERLEQPVTARIETADGTVEVPFGSGDLAAALRGMLYAAPAWRIPALVHRGASRDDWDGLAQLYYDRDARLWGFIAMGQYLSVICAEDRPRPGAPRTDLVDGWFAQEFRELCALWDVPEVDDAFREPIRSDRPVLLLSGGLDPSTPPRHAAEAAAHLPNGRHVVFDYGGHGWAPDGGTCLRRLERDFIEAGTVEGLDVSCVDGVGPGAFEIEGGATAPAASPM